MDFLDDINKETILIIPINLKSRILDYLKNKLVNIKIYSLEDIEKLLLFDYDEEVFLYLMNKYNWCLDICKMYINSLYYIENKKYNNEKLDNLVSLKRELDDNNLLKYNKMFRSFLKRKKIIIYGYNYLNKYHLKLLQDFDYEVINKKIVNNKISYYVFDTLEDEVVFVIHEIIKLINKGISLNNIYLLNINEDYKKEIVRLFGYFNIPVDINLSSNIGTTLIGAKALEYLKEKKDYIEIINCLKKEFAKNDKNLNVINKIVNIFNKYIDKNYDFDLVNTLIIDDFNNIKINNNQYEEMINVDNDNNLNFTSDDYAFFLGFNEGVVPKICKDEDYLSDKLKIELGINTSYEINSLERKSLIKNLKSIKNVIVSLKKNYKDEEYYASSILKEDIFLEEKYNKENISYSDDYSKLILANMLDELIKYDYKNPSIEEYYKSFPLRYLEYDNKYKNIDSNLLKKYINNELNLSYSNLNNFFKCQFRFLLNSILKLDKYEESLEAKIGTFCHYILSKIYNNDFDLESECSSYLIENNLSKKEEFYFLKLKKELVIIVDFILNFTKETQLKDVYLEKYFEIEKTSSIKVILNGIIDKIMYYEKDNETLISIIDYKTGKDEFNIDLAKYGIDMQLFIYLYLIDKYKLFDNPYYVGVYLQNVLQPEVKIDNKKEYLELKNNNLKLSGFSTNDKEKLEFFDPTYDNSKHIKSLKIIKGGDFASSSKVLNQDEFKSYISLVDEKIDMAINDILSAKFNINPKKYRNENIGCKYCNFKDICFMKNEDLVNLEVDIDE